MLRVFLAFLLMPPIASILLGMAIALTSAPDPLFGDDRFGTFIVITAGATVATYQVELFLGIPAHMLLKKLALVKWRYYFLIGTVINVPATFLLTIASWSELPLVDNLVFWAISIGYGCLMMTILWFLIYWRSKPAVS